jgi:hypothetical protein
VRIEIVLTDRDPPAGWARDDERHRDLAFNGWLDLLRVLSQLLGTTPGEGAAPL